MSPRLVPLVGLALLCGADLAPAQTTLRFKFAKGQVHNYEMVQDMKIAQDVAGNKVETELKQTIELSQTVDDVLDDGSAKVTTKFTRAKMDIKGPFAVTLDSANLKAADDNLIAKMMSGVVKTLSKVEFTATQKANGEMTDMKVPEAVLKEFRASPIGALAGDLFSDESLKQMMTQGGIVLPKEAVAADATWTQKVSNKVPAGKMTGELKYTYRGPETIDGKTFQKITYVPTYAVDPDAKAAVPMKLKGQKGNGTILFDNEQGRLHELVLDNTMEMSMAIANLNQESTIVQKVTMKLKK
jgi:hypothetical protein